MVKQRAHRKKIKKTKQNDCLFWSNSIENNLFLREIPFTNWSYEYEHIINLNNDYDIIFLDETGFDNY